MNRFATYALAAIAIATATAPAHSEELTTRFSLLSPLARERCALSVDAEADGVGRDDCMVLDVPLLADFSDVRPPLTSPEPEADSGSADAEGAQPGTYALSRNWTAAVAYHHELLFPTAANKDLRTRRFSLFSADQNRDVLDLHLSWRLSQLSELNLGYQMQSNRASLAAAAESYSVRRFVSETDLDHAVTIGITRRFGAGR